MICSETAARRKNNRKVGQTWPAGYFPGMSSTLFSRRSRRSFGLHSEPSLPVETCTYPAMKFGFFGTVRGPSISGSLQYEGLVCCFGCSGPHENTCEPRFLLKRFASGSSSSSYEFNPCMKSPLFVLPPHPTAKRSGVENGTHTLESAGVPPQIIDLEHLSLFTCPRPSARDARLTPGLLKRNHCDHFLWEDEKKKSGIAAFSEEVSKNAFP